MEVAMKSSKQAMKTKKVVPKLISSGKLSSNRNLKTYSRVDSEPVIIIRPLLQSIQDQLQSGQAHLAWIFQSDDSLKEKDLQFLSKPLQILAGSKGSDASNELWIGQISQVAASELHNITRNLLRAVFAFCELYTDTL